MDYGQPLQFGVFVTPANAQPDGVVELAVLADRAGLDLVSFQDHPYQGRFLDTWTLLTWVADQTSTIRIAGNMLNVPMRPAPELALFLPVMPLGEPGRDAAKQHADQQHRIEDHEHRDAEPRRGRVGRGERIPVDHHQLPVGERKHDQQHAQRHQQDPTDQTFCHALP